MTDTERLDKMQEMMTGYGQGWVLRYSNYGAGLRLHETSRSAGTPDIRDAIDNFLTEMLVALEEIKS